jgi:CRISPR-associated protein Cmr3
LTVYYTEFIFMFNFLVTVRPIGLMYGSTGGFLSPDNLVGRAGAKFPPEAAALSGLILSHYKAQDTELYQSLRTELFTCGPFWAMDTAVEQFYVPLPRSYIFSDEGAVAWQRQGYNWHQKTIVKTHKPSRDYTWQRIDCWNQSAQDLYDGRDNELSTIAPDPWEYLPMLHPTLEMEQRCVQEGGLFLENTVQLPESVVLVYLSSHPFPLEPDSTLYRFGGEGHLVEIHSIPLPKSIIQLLSQPIDRSCALITPGVWGNHQFSQRYPTHSDFSKKHRPAMITDRPVPYRYRQGEGKRSDTAHLGLGRYAVPSGSVYVFHDPLERCWSNFPIGWFPLDTPPSFQGKQEHFSVLRQVGVNLLLPLDL